MSGSPPPPAAAEHDTATSTSEQLIYGSPLYISMFIAESGPIGPQLMDPAILQSGAALVCIPYIGL